MLPQVFSRLHLVNRIVSAFASYSAAVPFFCVVVFLPWRKPAPLNPEPRRLPLLTLTLPDEVNADAWFRDLDTRQASVGLAFPPVPLLTLDELAWASTAAPASAGMPTWTAVTGGYGEGQSPRFPWHAPIWNSGEGVVLFVPGLPRRHVDFWREFILVDHP